MLHIENVLKSKNCVWLNNQKKKKKKTIQSYTKDRKNNKIKGKKKYSIWNICNNEI